MQKVGEKQMRVETLDKYIEIRPCSRDKLSRDSGRSNP